jgi:hypothetical protein
MKRFHENSPAAGPPPRAPNDSTVIQLLMAFLAETVDRIAFFDESGTLQFVLGEAQR